MNGSTTTQMQHAPHGAMYVWVEGSPLEYAQRLARRLGREDLKITPYWRLEQLDCLRGFRGAIVIDHACHVRHHHVREYLDVLKSRGVEIYDRPNFKL